MGPFAVAYPVDPSFPLKKLWLNWITLRSHKKITMTKMTKMTTTTMMKHESVYLECSYPHHLPMFSFHCCSVQPSRTRTCYCCGGCGSDRGGIETLSRAPSMRHSRLFFAAYMSLSSSSYIFLSSSSSPRRLRVSGSPCMGQDSVLGYLSFGKPFETRL
jgi:hypothetical protein